MSVVFVIVVVCVHVAEDLARARGEAQPGREGPVWESDLSYCPPLGSPFWYQLGSFQPG